MRTKNIKITGLIRFRNESLILKDTLKQMSKFCDEIFCFDDASTDNSVKIARSFPKVKKVIENFQWNSSQEDTQALQRKLLFEYARNYSHNKWFIYQDADERIEFNWSKLEEYNRKGYTAVRMRLFDAYLTKEDKKPYYDGELSKLRKWFGPEYREIIFLFKNNKAKYSADISCQREPIVRGRIIDDGYVKHFGKAISIEHFNKTRNYYIKNFPIYRDKWEKRKAIHNKSDFNNQLILWQQKKRGVPLKA